MDNIISIRLIYCYYLSFQLRKKYKYSSLYSKLLVLLWALLVSGILEKQLLKRQKDST